MGTEEPADRARLSVSGVAVVVHERWGVSVDDLIPASLSSAARVGRALVALVVVRATARALIDHRSLDRLLASLDSPRRASIRAQGLSPVARRGLWLVEGVALRTPGVGSTCLYRSLARFAMFARLGLDARFVMALRPEGSDDRDLDGHAWVEIDGVAFEETIDPRMIETFVYPARPRAQSSIAP